MFKVGVLYRIQDFLEFVNNAPISLKDFQRSFTTFDLIPSSLILNIAEECSWITLGASGFIKLTDSGLKIIQQSSPQEKLRIQLQQLIQLKPPPWLGLLQRGRKAILRFANPDTVQCFKDAGLLDESDPRVATWWDEIVSPSRLVNEVRLLEIGRKGEWLSIEHEKRRVGNCQIWVALDNNSAGYDILSIVSRKIKENLVIEVKASEEPFDKAHFFLTRNEWEILKVQKYAIIHLWSSVSKKPVLFKMSIETLAKQIPADNGGGIWQLVKIPFNTQ